MIIEVVSDESIVEKNESRKPLFAFLLSVFFTGLGQMYNGQLKKGILLFSFSYILLFVCSLFNALVSFSGFVIIFSLLGLLKLFTITDAVLVAKKLKVFTKKKYNTWYFHSLFVLCSLVISVIFDTQTILSARTFVLTTTSGYPTTLIGDRVYAKLNTSKSSEISYGDMVVFNSPSFEVWTFRVIGLPGDKIEIKDRALIINGVKLKTTYEKDAVDGEYEVSQFLEELPNGFKHSIYRFKATLDSAYVNVPEVIVPANSYFLLGDNRDNAYDSRYIGSINKTDIFAQVMYVFWSNDLNRIGLDFRKSK